MARYVWRVQPVRGTISDPNAMDWTVIHGAYRLHGLETRAKAQGRAIDMARDSAESVPPGSELVVAVADQIHGPEPDAEVWRMKTPKTKRRPSTGLRPRQWRGGFYPED